MLFLRNIFYRLKHALTTGANKLKSIRFTKIHLKYWMWCMIFNLAFAVKGIIGLLTLAFVELELTAKPSMACARLLGKIRNYNEVQAAKKENPDSELAKTVVTSSTARFDIPDDDALDKILAKNAGAGVYKDNSPPAKSRVGNVKVTQNGKTLIDRPALPDDESVADGEESDATSK